MNWRKSSHSGYNGDCAEVASWRKSSYSGANGQCAEVGSWRKASYSDAGETCVEAGHGDQVVGVRDTKDRGDGPVLTFPPAAWIRFITAVRQGALVPDGKQA